MAIANAIPQVWAARVIAAYQRLAVWRPLVNDISSLASAGGDTINLTQLTTSPTNVAYVVGTAMAAPAALDDAKVALNLDQQRAWSFKLDDIDRYQATPNLIDAMSSRMGRALALTADGHLRAQYAASLTLTGNGSRLVASVEQTGRDSGAANVVKTYRQAMVDALALAAEMADSAGWPEAGRWAVVSPRVARHLAQYAIAQGYNIGSQQQDAQLRGRVGPLFGWAIHVDPAIPTASNAADRHQVYCGVTAGTDSTLYWAEQIREVEVIRMQLEFADLVRGLHVYGAARSQDGAALVIRQTS